MRSLAYNVPIWSGRLRAHFFEHDWDPQNIPALNEWPRPLFFFWTVRSNANKPDEIDLLAEHDYSSSPNPFTHADQLKCYRYYLLKRIYDRISPKIYLKGGT